MDGWGERKMSEARPHFAMPDDADSQSCEIWREAALDETDQSAVDERVDLKNRVFAVFFGSEVERRSGRPLPFNQLPQAAVDLMPKGLKAEYLAELKAAKDPRSGLRVRHSATP